jgi:hypothetical protein
MLFEQCSLVGSASYQTIEFFTSTIGPFAELSSRTITTLRKTKKHRRSHVKAERPGLCEIPESAK